MAGETGLQVQFGDVVVVFKAVWSHLVGPGSRDRVVNFKVLTISLNNATR